MNTRDLDLTAVLPDEAAQATLVGRAWTADGPRPFVLRGPEVLDLSPVALTTSQLLALPDPVAAIRAAGDLPRLGTWHDLLGGSLHWRRDSEFHLLAPNDLQAVKAAGVTFVRSLLERVVEEHARGDATKANELRGRLTEVLGSNLADVKPGSPAALELKQRLIAEGMWSQYLEVGIGKDAEVFTKCQPMASVGFGAEVGILADSQWNNPEPEVVLACAPSGQIVGATLGNDVNLRDYEGRSALLLGKAKDENASCSIGPLIRLFDETFTLEQVRTIQLTMDVQGSDGFHCRGTNRLDQISRTLEELARQTCGRHHQYPDGFMLFTGTMFAPTEDRGEMGKGFYHRVGDRVSISCPELGSLINFVNHCELVAAWQFGTTALINHLLRRVGGAAPAVAPRA